MAGMREWSSSNSLLQSIFKTMKIHARNTFAKRIAEEDAQRFLFENHRQGVLRSGSTLNLGLFENETKELLAVVQFGYPRTRGMQKRYSLELLRMAFRKDTRVQGGASKLIKFFIREHRPSDFFTYQDASGEATAVYERAGMKFVSQAKKKQYLVAPGKTLATATRKEALGMAYATRYGPDRILGTKLGEVYDETGTRKSNKQLFLEELGWHIEDTDGDRVYEWVDPNRTYYTYKITASDSDKYYYGVSHVKKANATVEDCLNDGYWGSGGRKNKFSNWKRAHRENLQKEIISLHSRKAIAFSKEKELVGELWKTDRNCLNSTSGGKGIGVDKRNGNSHIAVCPIHGKVKFLGNLCLTCRVSTVANEKECPTHGETTHFGDTCMKCAAASNAAVELDCPKHGVSKHRNGQCLRCRSGVAISLKNCPIHGKTKHTGDSCLKCRKTVAIKSCPVHGETKHMGDTCYRCAKNVEEKICPTHGSAAHSGNQCYKCLSEKSNSKKNCPIHGLVNHVGESCSHCVSFKNISMETCAIHGVTKHRAGKCARCVSSNHYSLGTCEIHGETKFLKGNCRKCMSQSMFDLRDCHVHGSTKHQKGVCLRCRNSSKWTIQKCPVHGETKHNSGSCSKCKHSSKIS